MHRLILLLMVLLISGGCSSFDRDFNAARSAQGPKLQPTPDIAGAWEGRWQSDNGHGSGRLRCLLTPLADGAYQARFRATYWGILKASYTVILRGAGQEGQTILLSGEEDLGFLAGGTYQYRGRVTPADFSCAYSSKYDHGTFTLTRPPPADAPRTQSSGSAAHAHP